MLMGTGEEPTFLPRLLLLLPFAMSTAGVAVAAMATGRLEVGEKSRETVDIRRCRGRRVNVKPGSLKMTH